MLAPGATAVDRSERSAPPVVAVSGIDKRFGGITALRGVDVEVHLGTVHALVGENGAGKSTLGKVLSGVHQPDAGTVTIDGEPAVLRSPRDALAHGITTMAQEISLVPDRSVIENVFLGIEPARAGVVRRADLARRFDALCERLGFRLPPERRVRDLRPADQQKTEVLRAVARGARLIVMDEPTATLTRDEVAQLLDVIRRLRADGTAIVYVSHFLEEVLAVADTVTVMRDGELVHTVPAAGERVETLVQAMLGRSLDASFPPKLPAPDASEVAMAVRSLRTPVLQDVSFEVARGEILGIGGLVGSGRTEVLRAVFGADRREHGEILVAGQERQIRTPRDAIAAGIALIPEGRKTEGLVLDRSIRDNVELAHPDVTSRHGMTSRRWSSAVVAPLLDRLQVESRRADLPVDSLSGGNQQRVLFARWLLRTPTVLLADEPTRGVDVGSKRAIYDLLQGLADDGVAVVVVSSEIEELIGLCHRVLVMREGRVVTELTDGALTEQRLMSSAFGMPVADREEGIS